MQARTTTIAPWALDRVVDVSGPPSRNRGGDAYSRFLRQRGLLDAVAADQHQRYLQFEYEPRASLVAAADYHDSFVTAAAIDFLRAQPQDKPLCLVVSLHSPHPPLDAPGAYATMYNPEELTLPDNVPERFKREGRSIRTATARYTEWTDRRGRSLGTEYDDHATDPDENVNLAAEPRVQDAVVDMARRLHEGWRATVPAP